MSYIMTAEHKAKLSAANLGHHPSMESRMKSSAAHLGHVMSESNRQALYESNLGSHRSEGAKAKMSAAARRRKARFGVLSPAWKGGITPVNQAIRNSSGYQVWRTAVFERDDYTCRDCGERGGRLEAHHIHGFAHYPDERFVVENGKTLCLACHDKIKPSRVGSYVGL
jgi:hypothetical protein